MKPISKLVFIALFLGLVIGIILHIHPILVIDSIRPLLFGILLVPIVFLFNKYLEFNDYLRLLSQEIKENLDLIENLPEHLKSVRNGERAWLPAIASNRPSPGYSLKYLSLNIYENFINQKYWIYLNKGTTGRLAELYHFFRVYCDTIQHLQTRSEIVRSPDSQKPINAEFFFQDEIFNQALGETKRKIYEHVRNLNLDDIQSFKDDEWWCPNWLKTKKKINRMN